MDKEIKVKFLTELAELLEKYEASIGFSVSDCSDTYGLYDEQMYISVQDEIRKDRHPAYTTILKLKGYWDLDSNSIKEFIPSINS